MTNEQTIEAVMKAAADLAQAEVQHHNMPSSLRAGVFERKGAALRHAITAALAAKDAEIERLKAGQEPVCWAVIDQSGGVSVEYTAAWKEACHEHISDCITEHDIDGAKGWVVRPLYITPMPATEPAKPAPGEWIEWKGGECPIADGVRHSVRNQLGKESLVWADASSWRWEHLGIESDISAYRVLP